jgi:hypothetical protein
MSDAEVHCERPYNDPWILSIHELDPWIHHELIDEMDPWIDHELIDEMDPWILSMATTSQNSCPNFVRR